MVPKATMELEIGSNIAWGSERIHLPGMLQVKLQTYIKDIHIQ